MTGIRGPLGFLSRSKLRTKLIISFVLLIIIPTIVMGLLYFEIGSRIILQEAGNNIYNLVKKNNQIIDSEFGFIENEAVSMHIDQNIFDFFNEIDPQNQYELSLMDKTFSMLANKYFPETEDIYSVNLVTSYYTFGKDIYEWLPRDGFSRTRLYTTGLKSKNKFLWIPTYDFLTMFSQSEQDEVKLDYRYIFSAARLINSISIQDESFINLPADRERPVLVVNFRESMFKRIFNENVTADGSHYYILTPEGQVVSHPDSSLIGKKLELKWAMSLIAQKSGSQIVEADGQKMLACFDTSKTTGWTAIVLVPYDNLLKTLPLLRFYTVYMAVILIIISIIIAFILSGRITLPIKRLISAIKISGEGNFKTVIQPSKSVEFGYLISKYNEMNIKIQRLIEENYEIKLKEKEAEIMALNLQFNPHFMYNTLNIINWIAIENRQKEISKMLMSLSDMLQYTVKNRKEMIKFGEDLIYLKAYIYLMSKRFENQFEIHYEIAPDVEKLLVPKFFLQPFVENSFIHGFEVIEAGGEIRVSCSIDDGTAYFYVEDNGKGMDVQTIDNIMQGRTSSIGIMNINKRIKLLYGEKYGVKITSQLDKGTSVQITIPARSQ